ncbi:UvrB/UvrC motif-containing protein [Tuberibacillus sp. Marseille-P3662]|uniref:UvrB/UvrC motif-containing protein n=1 Tax=Tuberibacillus sp. Marseille-P3662 TaxID=1965358 RepID=UPI000A1CE5A3|nr:UvrB/UvrC motif-containing protein [Tuberibacillus sp. Marseille-P3662]
MECQECHSRSATLHFTKIINGEKMEYHLCEECAKEKGDAVSESSGFSIHNLLSGMLNFDQPMDSQGTAKQTQQVLQCSKCGLSYQEFAKIGKFGCEECYETFKHKLDPVLRKVHSGNTTHSGKIPKRAGKDISIRKHINSLREQLKTHVEQEEFEKAAELRDEIRSLENGGEA